MKTYLEEHFFSNGNFSTLNTIGKGKKPFHKQSPSFNFDEFNLHHSNTAQLNKIHISTTGEINNIDLNNISTSRPKVANKIINCDNNIENYYFNNINISTDDLAKRIPINLNLDTGSKHQRSGKKNISTINTINSMSSIKTINSINSINSLSNSNNNTPMVTPFYKDNFTSRNMAMKINSQEDFFKKSNIARMKNFHQNQGQNYQRTERGNMSSNPRGDITDFLRGSYNPNLLTTSRDNSMNINHLNTTSKKPKFMNFKDIKDINASINISPFKRNTLNQSEVSQNNSILKNVEILPKLAGDDEIDIFSDDENNIANAPANDI
jgi:hypothetical protein